MKQSIREIISMFAQNIKQVSGTCSVPFSGSGGVAHGTHLSEMEKTCSTDFPGVYAGHTRVFGTTVRAEPGLWLLSTWPRATHEFPFPKGRGGAQAGAAVPVCQQAEDAACCGPSESSHQTLDQLCHPVLNTPSLNISTVRKCHFGI